MPEGIDVSQQVSSRVSIVELLSSAAHRAYRYPVATLIVVVAVWLLGKGIELIVASNLIGYGPAFVVGAILSILITLSSIALLVMNSEDLPNLGALTRTLAYTSIGFGVGLSLPLVLVAHLLPERIWDAYLIASVPPQIPFVFATLGPILLFGMLPVLLVAWPIRARHDTDFETSIQYVWRYIENRRYRSTAVTVAIATIGSVLCFVPFVGLLVPAILSHMSAVMLRRFDDDITVHEA